jgi:hypothetical protein
MYVQNLTQSEEEECAYEAHCRVVEHIADAASGDVRALNSYGQKQALDTRTLEERSGEAFIGAVAERIVSKLFKCPWTKEMGQYKGNTTPDLTPVYRGKVVGCEVRGTRTQNKALYRPHRDDNRTEPMFANVAAINRPICRVGYAFFKDLKPLVYAHPEWKGLSTRGKPYSEIPTQYFSDDFSEFG